MRAVSLSEHPQDPAPNATGTKGNAVYTIITNQILKLMEQGQMIPWHRPWSLTKPDDPMNIRGTPYRGANYFMLSAQGYQRPIFLTFRQALELGGNVRKGEHGIPVVYWKMLQPKGDGDKVEPAVGKVKLIPFLRYYMVFNIEQCENLKLPAWVTQQRQPPPDFSPIEAAESIWTNYPNPPKLRHICNRAYYSPSADEIVMPARHAFDSPVEYYSCLFHEMGHSTGYETRLNRDLGMKHGHQAYAREELIAEMTSAFLCAKAGISQPVISNQAAYLAYWSQALRDDPKLFVTAAGKAQRAADFVLNVKATDEAEPLEEKCA
jgi:antirestriction protein ArdC